LLGAGCAGALGAVFGAPIGGVLFSIEVTSTYYPVTNYWTAFCCGISASTFIKVLNRSVAHISLFRDFVGDNSTKFSKEGHDTFKSNELPLFLLLGLIFGLIGLFVVKFNAWVVAFRRKHQAKYLGNWADGNLISNLAWTTIIWMVFLPIVQTLQFPAGVVGPSYILGAFGGRFFGEVFRSFLEESGLGTVDARVYAVVGAAASLGSITKTISPAVIVMEITNELTLSVPLLLAVIVGCGVVSAFGEGFFDSGLKLRGIPMLPIVPSQQYKVVTETTVLKTNQDKDKDKEKEKTEIDPEARLSPNRSESALKPVQYTVLRFITATDVMEKTTFITVRPRPSELVEAL
ncbi:chloride channel protein 2, partial [Reticulomyxa filosa]